jgi:hypothetical protein
MNAEQSASLLEDKEQQKEERLSVCQRKVAYLRKSMVGTDFIRKIVSERQSLF